MVPPDQRTKFDKNVSPNWKPVAALEERKSAIHWSDRIWYWLVSLGGLAIMAVGGAMMWYLDLFKTGAWIMGLGFVVFAIFGTPSSSARNGYID